jgi:hypothetical protein
MWDGILSLKRSVTRYSGALFNRNGNEDYLSSMRQYPRQNVSWGGRSFSVARGNSMNFHHQLHQRRSNDDDNLNDQDHDLIYSHPLPPVHPSYPSSVSASASSSQSRPTTTPAPFFVSSQYGGSVSMSTQTPPPSSSSKTPLPTTNPSTFTSPPPTPPRLPTPPPRSLTSTPTPETIPLAHNHSYPHLTTSNNNNNNSIYDLYETVSDRSSTFFNPMEAPYMGQLYYSFVSKAATFDSNSTNTAFGQKQQQALEEGLGDAFYPNHGVIYQPTPRSQSPLNQNMH